MSRKSRNNRRKTQGRFTTNPTQYLQFQNRDKYIPLVEKGQFGIKSVKDRASDFLPIFTYCKNSYDFLISDYC